MRNNVEFIYTDENGPISVEATYTQDECFDHFGVGIYLRPDHANWSEVSEFYADCSPSEFADLGLISQETAVAIDSIAYYLCNEADFRFRIQPFDLSLLERTDW